MDRFLSKVEKTPHCWEWRACRADGGYGGFWLNGKTIHAHRAAYQLFVGPVGPGVQVCHTCDNRNCVNPAHLWLGSIQDNTADRDNKKRQARGERNGGSKLSDKAAAEIRASTRPAEALALVYGVTASHIREIRSGRKRKI